MLDRRLDALDPRKLAPRVRGQKLRLGDNPSDALLTRTPVDPLERRLEHPRPLEDRVRADEALSRLLHTGQLPSLLGLRRPTLRGWSRALRLSGAAGLPPVAGPSQGFSLKAGAVVGRGSDDGREAGDGLECGNGVEALFERLCRSALGGGVGLPCVVRPLNLLELLVRENGVVKGRSTPARPDHALGGDDGVCEVRLARAPARLQPGPVSVP